MKSLNELVMEAVTGKSVTEASSVAYDVYLNGKLIDTVFYTGYTADEVKDSLIDHDGYDPDIEVKKSRRYNKKATVKEAEEIQEGTDSKGSTFYVREIESAIQAAREDGYVTCKFGKSKFMNLPISMVQVLVDAIKKEQV